MWSIIVTKNNTMTTKRKQKKSVKAQVVEKQPKTKVKEEKPVKVNVKLQHKKVFQNLAENGGSLRKAIKQAGYSDTVADNPSKITKSKSWKALLDQYLPESRLLEVHDQQLNSYKLQSMTFQKQIDDETIYELMESINAVLKKIVEIPIGKVVFYITADNQSRNKALEMGLKLHKRLTDKVEVKDTTPFTGLTDQELAERIKKGKNFFTKK